MARWLLVIFALYSSVAFAVPRAEILSTWDSEFSGLANKSNWLKFTSSHTKLFPDAKTNNGSNIVVEKETLTVKGDTFTVGTSYRQVLLNAKIERVKEILSRPELFQTMYELDQEARLDNSSNLPLDNFEARIYKKLPSVLPDQDYTLKYSWVPSEDIWFQRVRLVEDKTDFALRETLVVIEPYEDKVLFREIGKLYPLSWVIRAMGPQIRSITATELSKMSILFKCVVESTEPATVDLVKKCKSAKL